MANIISFDHHVTPDDDSPIRRGYPRCPKHRLFFTYSGCKFCIDLLGKYPVEQSDLDQLNKFWCGDAAPQGANINDTNR